jgi:radical SAM protein with 4Fe4S-binding SPASM domain
LNDFNLPRLEDLAKLAVKQDCHIRTNRLYNGGTILNYVDEYKFQMKKMFNVLLEAKSPMWPNIIMESTVPTYPGPKNPCLCGKRYIVIDVDGTIRSCNPDQDTKIGSIYTHNFKDLKFPQRWSAKNLPECQGCEWITWCQGGCPYTRKLAYGTYERKSPFCSAFKELFPMLMELKKKYENRIITRMVDSKEDLDQIKEMFGKGVR